MYALLKYIAKEVVLDYITYEDTKFVIRKLDGLEFRNPFSHLYIRVRLLV